MTKVLFATNRQRVADTNGIADFNDITFPDNGSLHCGVADVDNISVDDPSSGKITGITALQEGSFDPQALAPFIQSPNDVLVFIHGAANTFDDAIKRTAFNQAWLATQAIPNESTNFDVIAFTWPARAYSTWNVIGDYTDYRHDQDMAWHSESHFCLFLQQLYELRTRIGNRRVNLLCHSMGNYMLGWAVNRWFGNTNVPPKPLFDEIVLAAPDEPEFTFSPANNGNLVNLWRLGREISVYFNNKDVLMALSHMVNQNTRLGYDGPPNKPDMHLFSTNVYEFIDCTKLDDYVGPATADQSHQYYRQSLKARSDIAATLAGVPRSQQNYHAAYNYYDL